MENPIHLMVSFEKKTNTILVCRDGQRILLDDLIIDFFKADDVANETTDPGGPGSMIFALKETLKRAENFVNEKDAEATFKELISLKASKVENYLDYICSNKTYAFVNLVWSKWEKHWDSKKKKTATDKAIDNAWQR